MAHADLHPVAATGSRPDRTGASCPPYQWLAIVAHLLTTPYRESPPPFGLIIDRQSREIRVGSAWIELTFREFELLDFLVSNPGRVFSRGQLLRRVWGREPAEGTRTVDVHMHRLRRKLGASHGQCLVTVRRVGYKFAPPGHRPGLPLLPPRPGSA
jgi:DNA-binding response OmpR family regulator